MSYISTAYDAIEVAIETALPNHKELTNPYLPDENSDLLYDAAWGLAFSDGINLNANLSCKISIDRSFVVILTRKLANLRNDVANRKTTEKLLFEDLKNVIYATEFNPSLSSDAITSVNYVNDGGLEFVRTDRNDLIMIRANFSLVYFENF